MQILALARLIGSALTAEAARAAAERAAEHIENVLKAAEAATEAAEAARAAAHAVRIYARMTESVILTLFVGVRQNAVGFVDFFEFLFSFLVSGILVGVVFHSHLTKSLFNFLLTGALLQAKHFIVIAFFCHNKPLSLRPKRRSRDAPASSAISSIYDYLSSSTTV